MTTVRSRVRYVLLTIDREPVELDLRAYRDPFPDTFLEYYANCFNILEDLHGFDDWTVYIVWNYQFIPDLPSYGDRVIVLILQDEYGAIPRYVDRVAYVFKAYGFRPCIDWRACFRHPATLSKAVRDLANWLYHIGVYVGQNGIRLPSTRCEVVPLGYARQIAQPIRPPSERPYFMSFVGSVEQERYGPFSPKRWIGTPKAVARSTMTAALKRLAATQPDIVHCETASFMQSILSDGVRYSQILADTRICLAPRGSSSETYRFFEGMRQGCVVLCDRLPGHWFYQGCPAIQIEDWRRLHEVAAKLRGSPALIDDLHHRSLQWWEEKCSETALARRMSTCLAGLATVEPEERAAAGGLPPPLTPAAEAADATSANGWQRGARRAP
ncbi:hypothetical protein [Jiella sp. M17.18]|uniref:hypothetical protein n=1 Tax=Jiella sp. M17.18 TaxID=3234247 RepID=UPI0034DF2B79